MQDITLLKISLLKDLSIDINISCIIFALIIFIILIAFIAKIKKHGKDFFDIFNKEIELNISLGGIGSIKIKNDNQTKQIAYMAWVELATRKAGIKFEEDHDVIVEVYDSWKELFERTRNLIKEIPANQLYNENTKQLVTLLTNTLNNGLRPHLTRWQAKFRRWYEIRLSQEKDSEPIKTPQEIQREYPEYKELLKDLLEINQQMIEYTKELRRLIF